MKKLTKKEIKKATKELAEKVGVEIKEDIETKKYKKFSFNEYLQALHKNFYFTDNEIIEIQMATLIGEKIGGEPLWVFIVAPPGALKTETLRCFSNSKDFYLLSDLTANTFVSGLVLGKGEKRKKIKDLLPQLDKKILIFKDFTTILEKNRDERQQIFAQLREIYDGNFAKKFGTMDEAVRYESRFGFLAGVTPIIDKHWKLMQQLGERFLKVRWEEDLKKTTEKARENEGKEQKIRVELSEIGMGFITNLEIYDVNFNHERFGKEIDLIAEFVAIARTPITIQDYRTDFYYDYIPTPERPTRLVKQFKKLARGLAIIRNKKEVTHEEIETLYRVARDTIPQDRLTIMKSIINGSKEIYGCSLPTIYNSIKLPRKSVERILEQLKMLELVKEISISQNTNYGYQETKKYYQLTEIPNLTLSGGIFTTTGSKFRGGLN